MYHYPTADDESVAIGYAENTDHKEETVMVNIDENAFRTYMFANYFDKLDKNSLLEILETQMGLESMIELARDAWELPFDFSEGKVNLVDPDALLLRHSEPEEDCLDCPERSNSPFEEEKPEDNEEIWGSYIELDEQLPYYEEDKYAPYDELDEVLEEEEEDEKV